MRGSVLLASLCGLATCESEAPRAAPTISPSTVPEPELAPEPDVASYADSPFQPGLEHIGIHPDVPLRGAQREDPWSSFRKLTEGSQPVTGPQKFALTMLVDKEPRWRKPLEISSPCNDGLLKDVKDKPRLGKCSAGLVAPNVVVTAGHCAAECGEAQKRQWFAAGFDEKAAQQYELPSEIYGATLEGYENDIHGDWAVYRLDEPVPDFPTVGVLPVSKCTPDNRSGCGKLFVLSYPLYSSLKVGRVELCRYAKGQQSSFSSFDAVATFANGSSGSGVYEVRSDGTFAYVGMIPGLGQAGSVNASSNCYTESICKGSLDACKEGRLGGTGDCNFPEIQRASRFWDVVEAAAAP